MQNILILDCVQDVGNIGAIIRTAGAFNIDAVVYTTNKMPDISNNQTVAKLSSGGIEMVKLCQVTNLHRTIENLKKENFWVIGTDANGIDVKNKQIDSLNVSVATGIILWEMIGKYS